ncbi:MAG: tetratricopeptide repeat protein [Thermosynechococcaceae cyanobacterium]
MLAFERHIARGDANPQQVNRFLKANSEKLNEVLLEALPLVFTKLTAHELPDTRQQIARLFVNFAAFLVEFPQGDRLVNIELSLSACQLALKILTREAFPEDWATTQNNLGNAYSNRIRGERAENIERAIATYEFALQVRTREAFPEDWATIQNNLGAAYFDRIRGERAENIERAIATYEFALQVRTREAFPEDWAATQNNLGAAYSNRIRGERAENIERAIAAYELALQVRTHEAFPENWAATQSNLGDAYRDQVQGKQTENLNQAILNYKQASQVLTRHAYPLKWAQNQGHLAEALIKYAALTQEGESLDQAITLLQSALEIAAPGSPDFIDSQYRLGTALSRRYEHNQDQNDLQQALVAYQAALNAISLEHYDRNQMWQAIPETQSILGQRLVYDGQWQQGLQLLLNSVNQLSTSDNRLAHAGSLYQVGYAHETLSDWNNARLYYRDALRLYKHLKNQPGIAKSHAGLGGVLVSQGHLQKGMDELQEAHQIYEDLGQPDQIASIDNVYQAAKKAMERQAIEVYV